MLLIAVVGPEVPNVDPSTSPTQITCLYAFSVLKLVCVLLIVCMGSACIALNAGLPLTTMARPVSVRVMAVSPQSDESISEVQDLIYENRLPILRMQV